MAEEAVSIRRQRSKSDGHLRELAKLGESVRNDVAYQHMLGPHRVVRGLDTRDHVFRNEAVKESVSGKARMRRVKAELRRLKTDLPLEFGSSIFVRYNQARPYLMRVLVTGPEGTPYDSGVFAFDVYCPPAYPKVPPRVTFLTTGGGTVRFNPNLYNNGKVCLSLLGTWSGPGWVPNHSTLLQVFVSIQALIFVPEPYFNEPGFEVTRDTAAGATAARTAPYCGWQSLRVATLQWAIADQLKHPTVGFEEVVRRHFWAKKAYISNTLCDDWMLHAISVGGVHQQGLQPQVARVRTALAGVKPLPGWPLAPGSDVASEQKQRAPAAPAVAPSRRGSVRRGSEKPRLPKLRV